MGYLIDFEKAIDNHDSPTILRLWEEYTSTDEVEEEDFHAILEVVKASELKDYIGRHIERGIPLWNLMKDGPLKDDVLRLIVDLEVTENPSLRTITIQHLKKKYGEEPLFSEKMRLIGLRGGSESFKGAISHYELLNHFKKGNFVFHTAGWGVGELLDISMIREQIDCEFDYAPGRKDLSFRVAFHTLTPIPKTHFLARRFGEPDELEAEAKKNPVHVIRMLLKDLGPKTAAEIKEELCELVIPENEWNKWWQTARSKIKKDTQIENPKNTKLPFLLLKEEVSHEQRLLHSLEEKVDIEILINRIHSFFKDFSDTLKNTDFKATLLEKLKELIASQELSTAQELQLHYFLQDLSNKKEYPPIDTLLQESSSIHNLIKEIPIQALKKRTLINVQRVRQDWETLFLDIFFNIEQNLLRDFIFSELTGSNLKEALNKKLSELSAHPQQHPELAVWYFQKIMANENLPFGDNKGRSQFFEALLILLSYLEYQPEKRDLVKKIQGMITANRFALVRKIMKNSTVESVREFLLLTTKCQSITDHDLQIFQSLAEVAHPELKKGRDSSPAEDDLIWTTKKGYASIQKKIEKIGTIDTVENAKEIEIARSHGDLRENAEFKAALERRDRLQAELKMLSDQFQKCRILTKDDIDTKTVGIGTRITLKTNDEDPLVITLLGPWDADPDKNILSFQSKLAKTMLGKKRNETVALQGKTYTIEEISSAI